MALNVRDGINRSQVTYDNLSRQYSQEFVRGSFDRFMQYVFKFGNAQMKEYVYKIYQEVILDRNSELYASLVYRKVASPNEMVANMFAGIESQVFRLWRVINGDKLEEGGAMSLLYPD